MDYSKKPDYTKTEPNERGLCEYKIYGDDFKDIYGTPVKISDVSSPEPSIWITIMDDKMAKTDETTGVKIHPFFRVDVTGAKQLVKLLQFYIKGEQQ